VVLLIKVRDMLGENVLTTQVAISSIQEIKVASGAVVNRLVSEIDNAAESA
jgi:hypothetical protein